MKRLLAIILVLLIFAAVFASCGASEYEIEEDGERFQIIWSKVRPAFHTAIMEDTETGVLYILYVNSWCHGISVLYNADGTVMTAGTGGK